VGKPVKEMKDKKTTRDYYISGEILSSLGDDGLKIITHLFKNMKLENSTRILLKLK
jgi:hypothetical protein